MNINLESRLNRLDNLIRLEMAQCGITGIDKLDADKLTVLKLNGNSIEDISFLSGSDNLIMVDISDNNISDILPLVNNENLEVLSMGNNNISSIKPIENMKNLNSINISSNEIEDFAVIKSCTKLNNLLASGCGLISDDLNALEVMEDIAYLDISNN